MTFIFLLFSFENLRTSFSNDKSISMEKKYVNNTTIDSNQQNKSKYYSGPTYIGDLHSDSLLNNHMISLRDQNIPFNPYGYLQNWYNFKHYFIEDQDISNVQNHETVEKECQMRLSSPIQENRKENNKNQISNSTYTNTIISNESLNEKINSQNMDIPSFHYQKQNPALFGDHPYQVKQLIESDKYKRKRKIDECASSYVSTKYSDSSKKTQIKDCGKPAELIIEHIEKEHDIFDPNSQIFQYKKKIIKINDNTHDKSIENDFEPDKTPTDFIHQNSRRLWPYCTQNQYQNTHLDNDKVKSVQFENMLELNITQPEIISSDQLNFEPKQEQKNIKQIPENYKKKWIQKYKNDKLTIKHHQNEYINNMKYTNSDNSFEKGEMSYANHGIQLNEKNLNVELIANQDSKKYMHSSINQFQEIDFSKFTDNFAFTFSTNQFNESKLNQMLLKQEFDKKKPDSNENYNASINSISTKAKEELVYSTESYSNTNYIEAQNHSKEKMITDQIPIHQITRTFSEESNAKQNVCFQNLAGNTENLESNFYQSDKFPFSLHNLPKNHFPHIITANAILSSHEKKFSTIKNSNNHLCLAPTEFDSSVIGDTLKFPDYQEKLFLDVCTNSYPTPSINPPNSTKRNENSITTSKICDSLEIESTNSLLYHNRSITLPATYSNMPHSKNQTKYSTINTDYSHEKSDLYVNMVLDGKYLHKCNGYLYANIDGISEEFKSVIDPLKISIIKIIYVYQISRRVTNFLSFTKKNKSSVFVASLHHIYVQKKLIKHQKPILKKAKSDYIALHKKVMNLQFNLKKMMAWREYDSNEIIILNQILNDDDFYRNYKYTSRNRYIFFERMFSIYQISNYKSKDCTNFFNLDKNSLTNNEYSKDQQNDLKEISENEVIDFEIFEWEKPINDPNIEEEIFKNLLKDKKKYIYHHSTSNDIPIKQYSENSNSIPIQEEKIKNCDNIVNDSFEKNDDGKKNSHQIVLDKIDEQINFAYQFYEHLSRKSFLNLQLDSELFQKYENHMQEIISIFYEYFEKIYDGNLKLLKSLFELKKYLEKMKKIKAVKKFFIN